MNAQILFLLFFVAAPLVELYVLIEVGSEIGAFSTIVLSVFTAVLGGLLVRIQGLSVWFRVQKMMAAGEKPALEVKEAAALLLAGFALLLPGFITDTLGFILLITPLRRLLIQYLFRSSSLRPGPGGPQGPGEQDKSRIIEGEFRRDED